jgi:predicted house-cleaning noncanonical NTP pyrophosphatase (MazG superfamily)
MSGTRPRGTTDEKLVRDRIPEIVRARGLTPSVRSATREELDLLLRAKIVEEATEFSESGDIQELADIQEAIMKLLDLRGMTMDQVESVRKHKRDERGGFDLGLVMRL